jgi:hypothetical protein
LGFGIIFDIRSKEFFSSPFHLVFRQTGRTISAKFLVGIGIFVVVKIIKRFIRITVITVP